MLASVCYVCSVSCSGPNTVEEAAIQLSILHPMQQKGEQLATDQEGTQGRVFAESWWEWLPRQIFAGGRLLALGTASDIVSSGSAQKVRDGR